MQSEAWRVLHLPTPFLLEPCLYHENMPRLLHWKMWGYTEQKHPRPDCCLTADAPRGRTPAEPGPDQNPPSWFVYSWEIITNSGWFKPPHFGVVCSYPPSPLPHSLLSFGHSLSWSMPTIKIIFQSSLIQCCLGSHGVTSKKTAALTIGGLAIKVPETCNQVILVCVHSQFIKSMLALTLT